MAALSRSNDYLMAHYVIGDLHGYLHDYRRLLQEQLLCDAADQWIGGSHQLWLMGDVLCRAWQDG